QDRMRVRECSKQMREAIEESDFIVHDVSLYYGPLSAEEKEPHPLTLLVHETPVQFEYQQGLRYRVNCTDADALPKLLDLLTRSCRRIVCKTLTISCDDDYTDGQTVDEETLETICTRIDFQLLDLIFHDVFYHSVMSFASKPG
ncbi:hypothetical protein PFISCL1PPCAC_13264, partial [Pristionchus fissidentatus]